MKTIFFHGFGVQGYNIFTWIPLTLVLIGKGLVLGGWPPKIEVIWVPGIYIYIYIYTYAVIYLHLRIMSFYTRFDILDRSITALRFVGDVFSVQICMVISACWLCRFFEDSVCKCNLRDSATSTKKRKIYIPDTLTTHTANRILGGIPFNALFCLDLYIYIWPCMYTVCIFLHVYMYWYRDIYFRDIRPYLSHKWLFIIW